jgi:maleamate amidohydrolase
MRSAAIIVVDLQREFFAREYADQTRAVKVRDALVQNVNRLLRAAREQQEPVIFVVTSYRPDRSDWTLLMVDLDRPLCIVGTDGERMVPGIEIEPRDRVVRKTRYSAFYGTELDAVLDSLAVGHLIICGINTHACIRTTVVDAFMRDYRVLLPVECVASYDEQQHASTLDYLSRRVANVLSLEELLQRMRQREYSFSFAAQAQVRCTWKRATHLNT